VVADGQDMAATLIGEGHARPYIGDSRKSWCD
jgi:endonuclease YncB( thermonuclease family)